VPFDTLLYGVGIIKKWPSQRSPARGRDKTVACGRPSAPRYHTAWRRMRRGESDESARGTVTAVAFRGPHPCLSQGLSMGSPEAVFWRLRDLFAPMPKTLQKFSS